MSTQPSNGSWKDLFKIEITVSVTDPANCLMIDNRLHEPGGFLTSHRVVLASARVGHSATYDLLVDDGARISLTEKEYSFLKTLIKQMLSDASDSSRSTSSMGWVAKRELTFDELDNPSFKVSSSSVRFASHELARGIFDLRNKLAKHNISRELIESGKKGTHTYRISTSPQDLSMSPA
jgi:hypothetical protein